MVIIICFVDVSFQSCWAAISVYFFKAENEGSTDDVIADIIAINRQSL